MDDHRQVSISPMVGYRYDSRDSPIQPTDGITFGLSARATHPFNDGRDSYYLLSNDARYFRSLNHKTVVALLSNLDYQLGDYPAYSYLGLGGSGSLRGFEINRFRGHHRWFQTVEVRYLVLPRTVFPMPVIKEFDLSLGLVGFIDTGIVWDESQDFELSRFHGSTGLGLRFYSPVQDVFRVDVGFDLHGNYRLHTATGVRF